MAISADDRVAINDLIAMHGHLMDAGAFERLDELFSAAVVYDLADFGLGPLRGVAAIRDAATALGDRNPVGHHVTNVVLTELDDHAVRVRSKGIGINADGSCGSVVYDDVVERGPGGWRINYRKVTARSTPLGG
jgi:hypothetical protein